MSGEAIRQGFICPFCLGDFADSFRLQKHVDERHSEGAAPLHYVKSVLDKAKQKFTELDFTKPASVVGEPGRRTPTPELLVDDKPQELGLSRRHTEDFVGVRQANNDEVETMTNTLVIRLDKLLNVVDSDLEVGSKKVSEKSTVPWAEDAEHTNCKVCNAKFNLTRRKHHCRLCGKVMCSLCSQFLTFFSGRKLTNPEFAANVWNGLEYEKKNAYTSSGNGVQSLQQMRNKTEKLFSAIINERRLPGDEPEDTLRICSLCKNYLSRRERRMDLGAAPPVFVDLYDKLCTMITQVSNLAPSYRRMASSLGLGESLYTLDSAIQLKKKLVAVQREIVDLSERIENWGLDNDPIAQRRPTPRELVVQKNIRYLSMSSLQEVMADMPELPDEAEYKALNARHKQRMHDQSEREKAILKSSPSNPALNRSSASEARDIGSTRQLRTLKTSVSFSGLRTEDSWTPEPMEYPAHKNPFLDEEQDIHPVAQQYLIIKSYLKQAAQAGRLEEVEMLEQNLLDLESELKSLELATPRVD